MTPRDIPSVSRCWSVPQRVKVGVLVLYSSCKHPIFCDPSLLKGQRSLSWPKRLPDFCECQSLNLTSKGIKRLSLLRWGIACMHCLSELCQSLPSAQKITEILHIILNKTEFFASYLKVSLEFYWEYPTQAGSFVGKTWMQHSLLGNARNTQWEWKCRNLVTKQFKPKCLWWEFEMYLLVLVLPGVVCLHLKTAAYIFLLQS